MTFFDYKGKQIIRATIQKCFFLVVFFVRDFLTMFIHCVVLLFFISQDGDYSRVEQMLMQRTGDVFIDVDCKDKRTGNTALIWAAKKGNNKVGRIIGHYIRF
jgi:hypothetical protein